MKKLVKPYSLLLYFLAIVTFFFIGVSIAGFTGAGKNQGLAGGAIVFGYGVIASFFALVSALLFSIKLERNIIIIINKVLAIILLLFLSYFTWNYYSNVKPKQDQQEIETSRKPNKTINRE